MLTLHTKLEHAEKTDGELVLPYELREKSRGIPQVAESVQKMERQVPEYLTFTPAEFKGTFVRLPVLDDVPYPVQMNPNLVVEFYNR